VTSVAAPARSPRKRVVRWLRALSYGFVWLILAVLSLWAIAALYVDVRLPVLRVPLAILFALTFSDYWTRDWLTIN